MCSWRATLPRLRPGRSEESREAMTLTFPDYFPESFLARVVAADASAELKFRAEMSSTQCDVQRAVIRYVHTVALACAQATCEAVRAGEWPVADIAETVEEFWRRLRVYVGLELYPDWSSSSLVEKAFVGVRAARKLDQYAAQKVDHLRAFILCGSDRATVSLIPPSASSRQREPAWAGERPPRTAELHASM